MTKTELADSIRNPLYGSLRTDLDQAAWNLFDLAAQNEQADELITAIAVFMNTLANKIELVS